MYGSSFCIVTRNPRVFSNRPNDDAVIPFPSEEATPPVTKTCLVTGDLREHRAGDAVTESHLTPLGRGDRVPPAATLGAPAARSGDRSEANARSASRSQRRQERSERHGTEHWVLPQRPGAADPAQHAERRRARHTCGSARTPRRCRAARRSASSSRASSRKRSTGRTLYLLDEPTTGLHFRDIEQLLAVLLRLRDEGNTIVVIEHNLDVIKTADWVIDLGPEGGAGGGRLVAAGTPEEVARMPQSHTGGYLRRVLQPERPRRSAAG